MEQPLFSCTRCLKSFTHSQMAKSGTTCKVCTPHHSSFKQCEYCKSDFKHSISGTCCPRCQSLKSKHGDPHPCSICMLLMTYGNALVCQRCLHYRNKFGDPQQCQKCLQVCAFYKDEASRSKVDGQILCWVCTYNYKMSKTKERSDTSRSRHTDSFFSKASQDSSSLAAVKRQRTEDYTLHHSVSRTTPTNTYSMDSAYNEHILTIGKLQDEVKLLKRQLLQKDAELLGKDRQIGELRSELADFEATQRLRILKAQHISDEEINRLKECIRVLQREKSEMSCRSRKRRSAAAPTGGGYNGSPLTLSPLRVPPKVLHHSVVSKLTSSMSTPTLSRHSAPGWALHELERTPSQDSVTSSPVPTPEPEEIVTEDGDSHHQRTTVLRPRKIADSKDVDLNKVGEPEEANKLEIVPPKEPIHHDDTRSPSLSSSSSTNVDETSNGNDNSNSLKYVGEDEATTPRLV